MRVYALSLPFLGAQMHVHTYVRACTHHLRFRFNGLNVVTVNLDLASQKAYLPRHNGLKSDGCELFSLYYLAVQLIYLVFVGLFSLGGAFSTFCPISIFLT